MPAPHKRILTPEEQAKREEKNKRLQCLEQTKKTLLYIKNSGYADYMQVDMEQMNSTIENAASLSTAELQERLLGFTKTASLIEQQKIKDEEAKTTSALLNDFGGKPDQSMSAVLNGADAQAIHAHTLETMDEIMSSSSPDDRVTPPDKGETTSDIPYDNNAPSRPDSDLDPNNTNDAIAILEEDARQR